MVKVPNNTECCNLVGNFDIGIPGIISVSTRGNTATQLFSVGGHNAITIAPHTGSLTMTCYANWFKHTGCPGRATVSIPWIQKSDCDKYIYLYGGAGKSAISGDVDDLVEFPDLADITNPVTISTYMDASATSGPDKQYRLEAQYDGYGLIYIGNPWYINTTVEDDCIFNFDRFGFGTAYLQNLTVQCTPNMLPTVSMDFIYVLE